MKYLLSFLLCASLSLCVVAQDRSIASRRAIQPAPILLTVTGTDDAAGMAQTPMGYAVPLTGYVPAQSRIGLYGHYLIGVPAVVIWHAGGIETVSVQSAHLFLPGLESVVFHLPAGVVGEVWITTVGRQSSNTVRLFVESTTRH